MRHKLKLWRVAWLIKLQLHRVMVGVQWQRLRNGYYRTHCLIIRAIGGVPVHQEAIYIARG